jgi:hypothetical protein
MTATSDASFAVASWLLGRQRVSLQEWDRDVSSLFEYRVDPRALLRRFQVGWFAAVVTAHDSRSWVSLGDSHLLRCPAFANLGLLVGPAACTDAGAVEALLSSAGIRVEETPERLAGPSGEPCPPAMALAFSDRLALNNAAEVLDVDVVEPAALSRGVGEFTRDLGAADDSYLGSALAERWNPANVSWDRLRQPLDAQALPGAFRARLDDASPGYRWYLRCGCTRSSYRRSESGQPGLWSLWHSGVCPAPARQPLLRVSRPGDAWLEVQTRIPLPVELAQVAFSSAGSFPTLDRRRQVQLEARSETWPAVSTSVVGQISAALGLPEQVMPAAAQWPAGSRPTEHVRLEPR